MTGPSIPAIAAGTKTQSRRLINDVPADVYEVVPSLLVHFGDLWDFRRRDQRGLPHNPVAIRCRYGAAGDRLWIRESWRTERTPLVDGIRFAADDAFVPIASTTEAADRWIDAHRNGKHGTRWRSPLHMPRWASRLTLEIIEVRVQRLNDISEEDAQAEGIEAWGGLLDAAAIRRAADLVGCRSRDARARFAAIWEELHGAGAWSANPWLWALTFRRIA